MIREYRDTTKPFFFGCYPFKKIFVHLRLVNLVFFYTMRNGSIVLRESTLNLVLPRLTKESPINFFFMLYILQPSSRKKLVIVMYILEKTNENQRSTLRTLVHPPPPSRRRRSPRRCNVSIIRTRFRRLSCEKHFPPAISPNPAPRAILARRRVTLQAGRNVNRRRSNTSRSSCQGGKSW